MKSSYHLKTLFRFLCRLSKTAALILVLNILAFAQSEPIDEGFRTYRYGSGVINTPTAEKPESKLWWNDGFWWGTMWSPDDQAYHIYRFSPGSQSWEDTGTAIDDRDDSLGDALWDGSHLYIASHIFSEEGKSTSSSNAGRLYRYSYNSGANTYSLDSGFPVVINGAKSESLVIEKDSSGRLWAVWIQSKKVKVNCTDGNDSDWGTPFNLPVQGGNTGSDDVCSVIKLDNKIGVLWSNQEDDAAYFAVHNDGDSKNDWQNRETAISGQNNIVDDHINLGACDNNGNIYAVVKTSLTGSSSPKIYVLKRSSSGNWSSHVAGKESDGHTRPIVVVDSDNQQVYMIAKGKDGGNDAIYMKRASMSSMSFPSGRGEAFIKDNSYDTINNPSSTKQCINNTTGLLVLASDKSAKYYFHNYLQPLEDVTNLAPFISVIPDFEMDANDVQEVEISVTDPDGDDIELTVDGLPDFADFADNGNGSGSITFHPSGSDAGDYFIEVIAEDDGSPPLARNETFTVTVINANHPPQITALQDVEMNEGDTLEIGISANDEDGDNLALSAANVPAFGTFSDNGDGSGLLRFTPGFDDAGVFPGIEISATDNGQPPLAANVFLEITVHNVNRAPALAVIGDQETGENEPLEVTISGSDPDGDAMEMEAKQLPDFASFSENSGSGTIRFEPDFNDAGVYEDIEIIVSDNGSPVLSDTMVFALIVNNVNRAPVWEAVENIEMNVLETQTVSVTASDPDLDGIELAAENLPDFIELLHEGRGVGKITLSPQAVDYGSFSIEVIAADDGSPSLSDTLRLDIVVNSSNNSPAITIIPDQEMSAGDTLQVAVSAEDSDGDEIKLSVENLPQFAEFADFGDGRGQILFAPDNSDEGEYQSITIYAEDNGLPVMQSSTLFNLTVFGQNHTPFANNDVIDTDEDIALQIYVLKNDRDLNGDLLTIESLITENTIGTAEIMSGDSAIGYQPAPDFNGEDRLSYVITDGRGGIDTAQVTIHVLAVNDAPLISGLPDSLALGVNDEISLNLWDVISDPETPDIALDISIQAFPDTLLIHFEPDNGHLTVRPKNEHSQLTVSLRITVNDPEGVSAVHLISVGINTIPLGIESPIAEGVPQQLELLQNYPNPFNPSTEIRFGLPAAAHVKVEVLDLLGKPLALLLNDTKPAGFHQVTFHAGHLPSGIYLYRIQTNGRNGAGQVFQEIKRMILLK